MSCHRRLIKMPTIFPFPGSRHFHLKFRHTIHDFLFVIFVTSWTFVRMLSTDCPPCCCSSSVSFLLWTPRIQVRSPENRNSREFRIHFQVASDSDEVLMVSHERKIWFKMTNVSGLKKEILFSNDVWLLQWPGDNLAQMEETVFYVPCFTSKTGIVVRIDSA